MASRRLAAAAIVGVTLATPAASAAPSKQACVDAATRGQIQRDDGKLGAAEDAFAVCADGACPPAVRDSCVGWLADVRARRPSIVVHPPVSVPAGAPRLFIDGQPHSFGTTLSLDPGPHLIRVAIDGEAPFDQPFVLDERQARTLVAERPVEATGASKESERPVPLAVWLLGGVSVVGLASFAAFGLTAKSETDRLLEDCAPVCSEDARDDAFRTAVLADVSLGVAVVAAVAAGVLYVLRPSRPLRRATIGASF